MAGIEPGAGFHEAIFNAVDACVVLVAVIGPGWLASGLMSGVGGLTTRMTWVRLEIEAARARGVWVILVRVEDVVGDAAPGKPCSKALPVYPP